MSFVLPTLINAYLEEGYAISVGLNPWREAPSGSFAILLPSQMAETLDKPTVPDFLWTGGGIALDEIYFFETVLGALKPRTGFLIGVAAGWSTIALGLIAPEATLFALDNCSEGLHARTGLDLAGRIATKLGLSLVICEGSSPEDVPELFEQVADRNTFDFAFIDGFHSNEQLVKDFQACLPCMSAASVMVLHDVLNWNMLEGWAEIVRLAEPHGYSGRLLRRTSSGMGVLYRNVTPQVEQSILAFYQHPYILPSDFEPPVSRYPLDSAKG